MKIVGKYDTVLAAVTELLKNSHAANCRFIVQEVRPGTARFRTGLDQLSLPQHADFDRLQRQHERGRFGMLAVLGGRGDYGSILWLDDAGGVPLAAWIGYP